MGADSSTLQGIESLNSTLSEIESRLFDVEDIQLHHEAALFHNNSIVVAGKQIPMNPNCKLVVGPILGTIGTTMLRILVEVDRDSLLTFNVFRSHASFVSERFIHSASVRVLGHTPTALTIGKLDPDTPYTIYIGGVDASQSLEHALHVRTLSTTLDNHTAYFLHRNYLEGSLPGDGNTWEQLAAKLTTEVESTKILINLGDFLRLEESIMLFVPQILNCVHSDEKPSSSWEQILSKLEESVKRAYQQALTAPFVRTALKNCGFVSFAGESESQISALRAFAQAHGILEDDANSDWHGSSVVGETKSSSLFGYKVAEKTKSQHDLRVQAKEAKASLTQLVLSAVARVLRRTNWMYCRQLWDDSITDFLQDDAKRELVLRDVINVSKELGMKLQTQSMLASTFEVEQMAAVTLDGEVRTLQEQLRKLALLSGDMNLGMSKPAEMLAISCGSLQLIVFDTAWGHLKSDGALDLSTAELALEEQLILQLENWCTPTHKRDGHGTREEIRLLVVASKSGFLPTEDKAVKGFRLAGAAHGERNLTTADANSLLRYLALWQQADERRAAVIASCSKNICSSRYDLVPMVRDEAEDDIWKVDRCVLAELFCGPLCRPASFFEFPRIPFDDRPPEESAVEEAKFQRRGAYIVPQPCIWSVEYQPDSLSMGGSTGFGQPAALDINEFGEKGFESSFVVSGPIIGKVTSRCAVVVLEVSARGRCDLHCIDDATGLTIVCSRVVGPGHTEQFVIEGLQANRSYSLSLDGVACCGSFTTPRCPAGHYSTSRLVTEHVNKIRAESAAAVVDPAPPTDVDWDPFRVVQLGTHYPSATTELAAERGTDATMVSLQIQEDLATLLELPWGGFDVVVHFGAAVDWTAAVKTATSLLYSMERLVVSPMGRESEVELLMNAASEALRECVRSGWGANGSMRRLLSHGCHLFVSHPVLEVLRALRVGSTSALCRELTPFCAAHLVEIMKRVHDEFLKPLWPASVQISESVACHVQGSICFVQLTPAFPRRLDATLESPNLLDRDTVECLHQVLAELAPDVQWLVVLAPLPLVSRGKTAAPFLRRYPQPSYSAADSAHLLDICTEWQSQQEVGRRQVLLLCGSLGRSFSTTVTARCAGGVERTILQSCTGSLVGCDADDDMPPSDELLSKLPDVSYHFSHSFPESSEKLLHAPTLAVMELGSTHGLGSASSHWHSASELRSLRDEALSRDVQKCSRVMEDTVLQPFMVEMGNIWNARVVSSSAVKDAISHTELILTKHQTMLSTALQHMERRLVLQASQLQFYQELLATVITLLPISLRHVLRRPSSVSVRLSWQFYLATKGGRRFDTGQELELLARSPADFILFLKMLFCVQVSSEVLAWEWGLLD